MQVSYDKKEVRGIIYSGIFMQVIILLCLFFMAQGRDLAVFIVTVPILTILTVKNARLFIYLNSIKNNTYYLVLDNVKLICNSIFEGMVEINLEDIEDIQFSNEGILIYLKKGVALYKKTKLQNLFKYYFNNMEHIYKVPILGNRSEMQQICDATKEKINVVSKDEDVAEFASLCGRYIVILVGVLWGFLFHTSRAISLQQSLWELLILVLIMCIMRVYNTKALYSNKMSVGMLARCLGCSLTIAQYINCACKIEEVVKGTDMGLVVSAKSFFVVSIIYLLVVLLFFPHNGLSKRIISRLNTRI